MRAEVCLAQWALLNGNGCSSSGVGVTDPTHGNLMTSGNATNSLGSIWLLTRWLVRSFLAKTFMHGDRAKELTWSSLATSPWRDVLTKPKSAGRCPLCWWLWDSGELPQAWAHHSPASDAEKLKLRVKGWKPLLQASKKRHCKAPLQVGGGR